MNDMNTQYEQSSADSLRLFLMEISRLMKEIKQEMNTLHEVTNEVPRFADELQAVIKDLKDLKAQYAHVIASPPK